MIAFIKFILGKKIDYGDNKNLKLVSMTTRTSHSRKWKKKLK